MAKRRTSGRTQAVLTYPPHWFDPEDLLTFVELPSFSRRWDDYGLADTDLRCLQTLIMLNPKSRNAPIIEGTGGLRKMRCSREGSDKGKSGGYRVCYVYYEEFGTVLLVLIYPKNELDDIPVSHRKVIRKLVEEIRAELASRPYRAGVRSEGSGEEEQ